MTSLPSLRDLLFAYAKALVPWAQSVSKRMIEEVADRDRDAWRTLGGEISSQLHRDLATAPIGARVRELMDLQVGLITSIPEDAARRVHRLTLQGLESGTRARETAADIARSAEVTKSRAMLIARTETSRTATVLVQARAEHVGSTHYIWRSQHDRDVRPGHRAMDGKVCEWANPPEVNEGDRVMRHHPGEVWNCRCYADPILNDPYDTRRRA